MSKVLVTQPSSSSRIWGRCPNFSISMMQPFKISSWENEAGVMEFCKSGNDGLHDIGEAHSD